MEKAKNYLGFLSYFYEKHFSIKMNFFNELNGRDTFNGFSPAVCNESEHHLLFISQQLEIERVFDRINYFLKINFSQEFFNFDEIVNARALKGDYFVFIPQSPVFIERPLGGDASFNIEEHLTLLESLVFVLHCIDAKKDLSFLNYVLCGASKVERQSNTYIPALYYDNKSQELFIMYYEGFYAIKNLNKLKLIRLAALN